MNLKTNKDKSHRIPQETLPSCEGTIGGTPEMHEVFRLVKRVAPFDTSVLILGETGTGKEGIATCIVRQSKRSNKPYIKVNCAAIPNSLMESEFFGYEKGAFTGATERKTGKFELASGGTILLDEIGEMPVDMQVKLLRALQEKEIYRIGGNAPIHVDVRILAATSKHLETEIANGRFRLDLYYRLNIYPILLPPLRDRKADIPDLARHFIKNISEKMGKPIVSVLDSAIEDLLHYAWPGNIRELEHVIERSLLMSSGPQLDKIEIPLLQDNDIHPKAKTLILKSLEENERDYIVEALRKCGGKIAGAGGAAELLQIPPTTLHSKIKKLGIHQKYS